MPASKDTIGSDDMRPGRSGPDTGTEEGGEGAEFTTTPADEEPEQVSEADTAGWRKARGSAAEPGA